MWNYAQTTGELFDPSGNLVQTGYSGKGDAKNDPDQQCVVDMGPIPRGLYTIQPAVTDPILGPVAIPLDPDASNNMCGRSGFFIHGDNVSDPGNASQGCIIMQRTTRDQVNGSDDKRFQVVRQSALATSDAVSAAMEMQEMVPVRQKSKKQKSNKKQKLAKKQKSNKKPKRTPKRAR
jgi:hypothetical protein